MLHAKHPRFWLLSKNNKDRLSRTLNARSEPWGLAPSETPSNWSEVDIIYLFHYSFCSFHFLTRPMFFNPASFLPLTLFLKLHLAFFFSSGILYLWTHKLMTQLFRKTSKLSSQIPITFVGISDQVFHPEIMFIDSWHGHAASHILVY